MIDYEVKYPNITQYILEGKSVKELQNIFNISRTTVYAAKTNLNLIGKSPNFVVESDNKICNECNLEKPKSDFHANGCTPKGSKKYKPTCKKCVNSLAPLLKVNKFKEALRILNKEYKCEICGYNKNYAAIHFHHKNPLEKEFQLGEASYTASIETLVSEIQKCKVLCGNCHAEEHNPLLQR